MNQDTKGAAAAPAPHRISLCICTMNRPDDLRKCLESIAASPDQPHEVIVSDDSSEEIAPSVRAVASAFPGCRYTRGPRRGLSANRNHCLASVTGDLISFIDDDVVLDRSFIRNGPAEFDRLRAMHGTDRIVVTGSEVRPDGIAYASDVNFLCFYTNRFPEEGRPNSICINSTYFPAALFRSAAFDENYRFGSEESDISFQASHLGYRIVYSAALTNYHYPSTINRDLYGKFILKSRFYFGLKRYWIYEPSTLKFLLFNLYGSANAVGHHLKALRLRESFVAAGALVEAWQMFRSRA